MPAMIVRLTLDRVGLPAGVRHVVLRPLVHELRGVLVPDDPTRVRVRHDVVQTKGLGGRGGVIVAVESPDHLVGGVLDASVDVDERRRRCAVGLAVVGRVEAHPLLPDPIDRVAVRRVVHRNLIAAIGVRAQPSEERRSRAAVLTVPEPCVGPTLPVARMLVSQSKTE